MLSGSNIYSDLKEDNVGKIICQFNQLKNWTKEKHLASSQLYKLLKKNKYLTGSGRRNDYRLHGGTGKSFIYKAPLNKRGILSAFRGDFVRIICIGTNRYESVFMFKPINNLINNTNSLSRIKSIVSSRESLGMTSSWTDYLCLTYGDKLPYKLFQGGYTGLAEQADYYDENLDDFNIPDFINGEIVTGVEDGYIVGGELWYSENEDAVEFTNLGDEQLVKWLFEKKWGHCKELLKDSFLNFNSA